MVFFDKYLRQSKIIQDYAKSEVLNIIKYRQTILK
jgi:hypothetical protein